MLLFALALLAKLFSVSLAVSNGSNIIISSSGSSITLDQCNSQCASVNTVLFSTCSLEQSSFPDQMRCACSEVFIGYASECSSCCQELNYQSEFQELTQVISACYVIQEKGNTSSVASGLVYTTLFSTATAYLTATETQIQTYTAAMPTYTRYTTVYPLTPTVYYTVSSSETVYTTSATSVWSSTTQASTAYRTTSSLVAESSTSTSIRPALPTVSITTSAATVNTPEYVARIQFVVLLLLLVASALVV